MYILAAATAETPGLRAFLKPELWLFCPVSLVIVKIQIWLINWLIVNLPEVITKLCAQLHCTSLKTHKLVFKIGWWLLAYQGPAPQLTKFIFPHNLFHPVPTYTTHDTRCLHHRCDFHVLPLDSIRCDCKGAASFAADNLANILFKFQALAWQSLLLTGGSRFEYLFPLFPPPDPATQTSSMLNLLAAL